MTYVRSVTTTEPTTRITLEVIELEQQISENVSTLLHRTRLSAASVARAVGMSAPTFNRKMLTGPWHFSEVVRVARYMGVTTDELAGLEEMPPRREWERREVPALLERPLWAPGGSNPEPAD